MINVLLDNISIKQETESTSEIQNIVNEIDCDLNELAQQMHAQNVAAGWWKDMNRDLFQTLQLTSTELAEATEGERKDLMDDHIPHRKMGEVELADTLIRILDLAGRYQWVYDPDTGVEAFMFEQTNTIAGYHFVCTMALCDLGREMAFQSGDNVINCRYRVCLWH